MSVAFKIELADCLGRITRGNFAANDIRDLYTTLLREPSDRHGYTWEIANFLAHPARTKGTIHDAVKPIYSALYQTALTIDGKLDFEFEPINAYDLVGDLNSEITRHDFPELRQEIYPNVAIVILSALQIGSSIYEGHPPVTFHLR